MADMTDTTTAIVNKPAWVDLSTTDPAAARDFYGGLFGWEIVVNPDPQYGGYAIARLDGQDAAGIGGTQSPDQPAAWSLYIGTADIEQLAQRVTAAGGTVAAPPFDVADQGRMSVFQDPSGAFISAWQPLRMPGFRRKGPNAFSWAELDARDLDRALPFYRQVFGWSTRESSDVDEPYTEFQLDGESIAGAVEMSELLPAEVPSMWLVFFGVEDLDASFHRAMEAGGRQLLPPDDYPGGRFAILTDPQGAAFGLLQEVPG